MKYSCIIVDDEPLAHKVLLSYIRQTENLGIAKQCFTASDARLWLSANDVDILFLDIEMPEESGIHLLKSLAHKPVTIFTTAFLNYSLEGFELGVMDYLVKPIRYERFKTAVNRAMEFVSLVNLKSGVDDTTGNQETLLVKTGVRKKLVKKNDITHTQAMKDYVIIYTDPEKYVVRCTMKEMEDLLGRENFLRVHRSFIISKNKIRFFTANKIEFGNYEIPVGRKYKVQLLTLLKY